MTHSHLAVPEIAVSEPTDSKALLGIFRKAPKLEFGQSWAEQPVKGFRKGIVRLGWQGDRLYYLADLDDRDIFTAATRRNQNLWELGDVLEIFAGVHGQPGYLEYHTAPNGITLQLFWPSAEALASVKGAGDLRRFKRTDASSQSRVYLRSGSWRVFGYVTGQALGLPEGTTLGNKILDLNFGRYDYNSDGRNHVLSSTSPLTKASYHRRHEWRTIRLVSLSSPVH